MLRSPILVLAMLCSFHVAAASASTGDGAPAPARAITPQVRLLRTISIHYPKLLPPRVANQQSFVGSARFEHEISPAEVARLEALGVRFAVGHVGSIYPVRVPWDVLDALADWDGLVQLEAEPMIQSRAPLNVTRALAHVPQLSDQIATTLDLPAGQGIRIADNDSGIDPFHPAFFYADGGYYEWLDVDGDGKLTFGTDAVDLDRNGAPSAAETLRFHDVSLVDMEKVLEGWDAFDPDGKFEAGVDWVFADTNGNGTRDFGPEAGFGDDAPAFGEPVLLVDDVDQDTEVDPEEKLVLLKTSKIAKVLVKGKTEYVRGQNLTTLDPGMFPADGGSGLPGAAHGTGVAGILAANTLGLSRFVGVAPAAELYMIDHSLDDGDPTSFASSHLTKLIWARDQGVHVLLFESSSWGIEFMDGSSNFETAMDQVSDKNSILMVVPAGNLGGSGKHMSAQLTPGSMDIGIEVPEWYPDIDYMPFETPYLMISFYWYGNEDDISVAVTVPDANNPVGVPSNAYNPIPLPNGMAVAAQSSISTTSLNLRMHFIVDNKQEAVKFGKYKINVTNNSGKPVTLHGFLNDAVSGWGRMPIFTTNESNDSTICHPATANSALAVAAYGGEFGPPEQLGKIRPYSGRGPRLDGEVAIDIAAPDDPFTPFPEWHTGMFMGNKNVVAGYMVFGGTSGAGPHVAGVAALVKQMKPQATADEIASMITSGAEVEAQMGELPNKSWGFGKLDAYHAVFGVPALPNLLPTAAFTTADIDGYKVVLHAGASKDPEAGPLQYRFDFDYDGAWDTPWQDSAEIEHVYPDAPGRVVAKVAVRDQPGATASALFSAKLPDQYTPPPPDTDSDGPDAGALDTVGPDAFVVADDDSPGSGSSDGCSAAPSSAVPSALAAMVLLLIALVALSLTMYRRSRCPS